MKHQVKVYMGHVDGDNGFQDTVLGGTVDEVQGFLRVMLQKQVENVVGNLQAGMSLNLERFNVSITDHKVTVEVPGQPTGMAPYGQYARGNYEVVLIDLDANKIDVIKSVREMTGIGLKEAKDIVEAFPATVMTNVTWADACKIKELAVKGLYGRAKNEDLFCIRFIESNECECPSNTHVGHPNSF